MTGFVSHFSRSTLPYRSPNSSTCHKISGKSGEIKWVDVARDGRQAMASVSTRAVRFILWIWPGCGAKKLLMTGDWCAIRWSRAGQETGSIRVECLEHGLRLVYRQRQGHHDWQDVNEFIPFIETPTRFGGKRPWLQCLSCQSRCRIIYGGATFRCRRCHHLKYETQ